MLVGIGVTRQLTEWLVWAGGLVGRLHSLASFSKPWIPLHGAGQTPGQ